MSKVVKVKINYFRTECPKENCRFGNSLNLKIE